MISKTREQPRTEDRGGSPASAAAQRLLQSEELLAGENQVWIEHRGERYCLRLTSSGKLYLTK